MAEVKRSIGERLDQLQQDIQDEDFQAGRGTSNEENIHIYGYDPRDEMTVRCFIARLERNKALNCRLKSYNLYQVFLEMLQARPKVCERIPQLEARKGSRFLLEKLAGMITPQAFAEHMAYAPHEPGDVVLLHGVGSVYPFMRMHTLLEAIQPVFSDVPVVVLYPGVYTGRDLKLFNLLPANEYYRGFNIS